MVPRRRATVKLSVDAVDEQQAAGLARVGAVDVPVAGRGRDPPAVVPRHHGEAADDPLAALVVAVEQLDRHGPVAGATVFKAAIAASDAEQALFRAFQRSREATEWFTELEGWVVDVESGQLLRALQRAGIDFRRALYARGATAGNASP